MQSVATQQCAEFEDFVVTLRKQPDPSKHLSSHHFSNHNLLYNNFNALIFFISEVKNCQISWQEAKT